MHIPVMILLIPIIVSLFVISNGAVIDVQKKVVHRKIVERDSSRPGSDALGNWSPSTIKCEKPKPIWLRSVKVPFLITYYPRHEALEFDIECKSGSHTHYTVDFSKKGVERRFSRYTTQTAQVGSIIDSDLSIEQINYLTDVERPYNLVGFNCKSFVKKFYNILYEFNEGYKKIDPNNTLAVQKCLKEALAAKNGSQIVSTQISVLILLFISINQIVCYFYY